MKMLEFCEKAPTSLNSDFSGFSEPCAPLGANSRCCKCDATQNPIAPFRALPDLWAEDLPTHPDALFERQIGGGRAEHDAIFARRDAPGILLRIEHREQPRIHAQLHFRTLARLQAHLQPGS